MESWDEKVWKSTSLIPLVISILSATVRAQIYIWILDQWFNVDNSVSREKKKCSTVTEMVEEFTK